MKLNMYKNLKSIITKNKITITTSVVVSVITFVVLTTISVLFVFPNSFKGEYNKNISTNKNNDVIKHNTVAEESRIVDIVEKANPAVVSIVITKDVPKIEQYYENFNPFSNDFFNNFFENNNFEFQIPRQRQNGTEKREVGGGSGFFISKDGFLVTNKHVVNDKDAEYTVLTNDGKKYNAEVLAKDPMLDVAILKIKGNNFSYLDFGNSDILKPGQTVIAIGNALAEFRNSVSVGVISGLSRSIVAGDISGKSELLEGVIQTDAAINPGNSGGPLLDISGNVIGVNVAVQIGAQNIGFSLPSNIVKNIADSVKKYGEIVRPYLGIRYIQVTENLKKKNNLSIDYGVLVTRGETKEDLAVIPGSPADKAGIVENDIILEIDGIKLKQGKSMSTIIRQKAIGQKIVLKILHKGTKKEIEVKLEKAPNNL